jgi:uncharacterized protein YllA (UPF0747 family)
MKIHTSQVDFLNSELRRLHEVNQMLLDQFARLRRMCNPEMSHQETLMCKVIDAAIEKAGEA